MACIISKLLNNYSYKESVLFSNKLNRTIMVMSFTLLSCLVETLRYTDGRIY